MSEEGALKLIEQVQTPEDLLGHAYFNHHVKITLQHELRVTAVLRIFDRYPLRDRRPLMTCGEDHPEVWFSGPDFHERWKAHRLREHGDGR